MKKLVSTLLAGALLLSLLVTTAFAAEKITVSGKAGDTSVKVTVTGLKANSYYFGAIRMDGSVLNLFDGSANADGKLDKEIVGSMADSLTMLYDSEKIGQIMGSQLTEEGFRAGSDFVIDNSGRLEDSFVQIDRKLAGFVRRA